MFATVVISFIIYLFAIFLGNYVIDDEKLVMNSATSIVDQNDELIIKLYVENREIVPLQNIPLHVQQAFIAIEDARFYDHQGIDFRAITRAIYRDIMARAKVEGGSTITQQLAKNVFLSHDKSWLRKTKEVLIAMNLERKYSKDELLEMYLNRIYFGHGVYGIQAASSYYFQKDVQQLTIEEGALLAALPKAPNAYSPFVNENRSKERRDLVLSVMHKQGYLSAEEVVRLQGKTLGVINEPQIREQEPFLTYIDMVLEEAEEKYQLTDEEILSGGYTIQVPMDVMIQRSSYEKIRDSRYFPEQNEDAEAAFILLDNKTGGVLAVHGGREYVSKGINRVVTKRQPGSIIKPIAVYTPALEEGLMHPYSLLKDELIDYDGYEPKNYDEQYRGEISLFDALTFSANAPAVWLMNEIGIDVSKSYLQRFDLATDDEGLAIALGGLSDGYSPLEMAKAYRVFAHEGKIVDPYFIEAIYDRNGKLVGKHIVKEEAIISAQTAWYMTRMLENVVKEGTASAGETTVALAGKTGTTSFEEIEGGTKDAWFVGFTPDVVGVVWMGYDITTTDHYLRGGSRYPTVLFKDMMNDLDERYVKSTFKKLAVVNDIERPIRFEDVKNLQATYTFKGKGIANIRLVWDEPNDHRLQFNIYEVTNKLGANKIATVQGGQYIVERFNPFFSPEYFVVPYNPLTDQEGSPSELVKAHWFSS